MKDLTKGSSSKLIIQFALPVLLGNLFQLFYSLVDTRIIGSTLEPSALAAVGSVSSLNNLIIGFLVGLTNGFAILTAHDFGAKNEDAMRKNIAGTLILGVSIATVLTVISVGFLPQILNMINVQPNLMEDGASYIRIILLGMAAAMFYNVCASTLRAIGDTISSLIFLIISTIMNIGLDYLFICTIGMGVSGAALATVVSQMSSAIMCFIYMRKRYPMLRLKREDFKLSANKYVQLLASGISMGMMQSLVSMGTVILQGAINTFGDYTIVAHTAARKVTEFFMLPFSAFGMTMATYCGQNYGAGRMDRVKNGLKNVLIMAAVWCALVLVMSYTLSPTLIRMITDTKVQEVMDTGSLYLRVDTILYFVPAVICILRNSLQGLGSRWVPIISSFIELFGKWMVVMYLTPKLKYFGIILAEPIVWVVMVIPLIINMILILKRNQKTIL